MEAQVSLIAAFSSSALLGLVSRIFLFTIPHRFCMGFRSGEFAGQSSTESNLLEVQCKVSTVSDGLGCHVICWCWSTVFSQVQGQRSRLPGSFRALHASLCRPALWRCGFHFPAGLGTCTHCQRYQY